MNVTTQTQLFPQKQKPPQSTRLKFTRIKLDDCTLNLCNNGSLSVSWDFGGVVAYVGFTDWLRWEEFIIHGEGFYK